MPRRNHTNVSLKGVMHQEISDVRGYLSTDAEGRIEFRISQIVLSNGGKLIVINGLGGLQPHLEDTTKTNLAKNIFEGAGNLPIIQEK